MSGPVYLGFDLSTQQLKCLAITSQLKVVHQAKFDFDADSRGFNVKKGVLTNEGEGEVFAPVAMWLQALDTVLERIKQNGLDMSCVRGISSAGMQHGSVFWNHDAEDILANLDASKTLEDQLGPAFASPNSPNWQDSATQKECDQFDDCLGSEAELANRTGSKAHHRFTGPQIMRLQHKFAERYKETARISLVSSWIATVFLGKFAPFDISDVCGMNLWDIPEGSWNEKILKLTAGPYGVDDLKKKLGEVPQDGGATYGKISEYFVKRFGFNSACNIVASTGDNPSTLLALPLQSNDAMVSLGTSSTFLMITPEYLPDPAFHFFNSPVTKGRYMFMLCYKNGGLAREKVRNSINEKESIADANSWTEFDYHLLNTPVLSQKDSSDTMKLGIYFPRHEIVPHLPAGEWHYEYDSRSDILEQTDKIPNSPFSDARAIVESQFLSMRLRSQNLVKSPNSSLPPQPRRIYLVGGGSKNKAIAKICGEILGGSEGVYQLDVGENACALGAAHKAVWGCERAEGQSFEDLIGSRWKEEDFVRKIADGYQPGVFERYGEALKGFEKMENELLAKEERRE